MRDVNITERKAAPSVVVITEGGPHVWAIVNTIVDRVGSVAVIREARESKWRILRRRARSQGWLSAAGQFATMVLIRLLKWTGDSHVKRMVARHGLETTPRPGQEIIEVPNANAAQTLAAIDRLQPAVIVLVGCRMLKRATLDRLTCPVINYHAGITPLYRGMNGGYWALATGGAANFGSTVHLVDAGVDTGAVLRQTRGAAEPGDTIATYALRQAALSRGMCADVVDDTLAGRFRPFTPDLPSRQWYHPTLWFYLWTGLTKGVW